MSVPQKLYDDWQVRCDAFHEIITDENSEWVTSLVSFASEIESECPDSDVVDHARAARRQAIAFSNSKSGDRGYTFNGFLASLLRLSIALGIHLIGYHGRSNSEKQSIEVRDVQDCPLNDPPDIISARPSSARS